MTAARIPTPHLSTDLSAELPDVRISVRKRAGTLDDSTVSLMLSQIGRYPLLKLEQEQILSCQVAHLQQLNCIQVQAGGALNRQQWAEAAGISLELLDTKQRQGVYARRMMGNCNLRLVVSIAKRYVRRYAHLDMADLITAGTEGLMAAVDRFDPAKNIKFSTYATWWIRQAITYAIAHQEREIRYPIHVHDKYTQIRKAVRQLTRTSQGTRPTITQIAQLSGLTVEQIRTLLNASRVVVSLNLLVGANRDTELGDLLPTCPAPEIERDELSQRLQQAIAQLNPIQRQAIELKYGLTSGKSLSFNSVGEIIGKDKNTVRKTCLKAMKVLHRKLFDDSLGAQLD